MEIKKLLEIESIISGRKTPSDLLDDALNSHYSKSRGEEIKILDMHLPHLIRAYSNLLEDFEDLKIAAIGTARIERILYKK